MVASTGMPDAQTGSNGPELPGSALAAEQKSAAEKLVDASIYQGLSLQGVSADMAGKIKDVLKASVDEINGKLQSGPPLTDWQAKNTQTFLNFANKTIENAYAKIDAEVADDLSGVAKAEYNHQTNSVNSTVGVTVSPVMSTQQIEAIVNTPDILVNGAVMSDWWNKQTATYQHSITTTVQAGLAQGKSIQEIAADLKATLDLPSAQAEALVRTAVAAVQSQAQQAYYGNNDDIIKAVRWVSTLDSRTTPICQAMDGLVYTYDPDPANMEPIGHERAFPGYPPIHWNCRSTTVPVLKSWQDLSKVKLPHLDDQTMAAAFDQALTDQGFSEQEKADIQMNQQASIDGPVPKAMNYEQWLKTQPELAQKKILGPARWDLWHTGQISLKDMVAKDSIKPVTVDELHHMIANNQATPPQKAVEGQEGLTLGERQILTAQLSSGTIQGEEQSSWYNPDTGTVMHQTLPNSLTAHEDAQLQGQDNLIQLSNSTDKQLWALTDLKMWASQPGFSGASIVTPEGRVITVKLKPGKDWTLDDAKTWQGALQDAKAQPKVYKTPFKQQQYAFNQTGKVTVVTPSKEYAIQLDPSVLKKVYGPFEPAQPYVAPPTAAQLAQAAKDKAAAQAAAELKAQLQKADDAAKAAAAESQAAREKQADFQTALAEQRLANAQAAQAESAATVAKHQAKVQEQEQIAQAESARAAAAAKAKADAADELAAIEKSQQEAEALQKSLAEKKALADAAEAAAKKAQEQADIQASAEARYNQALKAKEAADAELAQHEANQQAADQIAAQMQAAKDAAKAQAKAVKAAKSAATKAANKAKKAAAAALDSTGKVELPIEPKVASKTHFPADPLSLPVIKELGGYTQAQLVQDADGNLWVRKRGANADHIASEALFDHLYGIAGVDIPESKLYTTAQGPVKLARYVPDTTILGDYLKQVSPSEKATILGVVQNQFVANALFANWDAVGANPAAGFDNILIGKNGKAYMIDTGGAGIYKGTGIVAPGKFGPEVGELKTMLNPSINPTTAPIFKGITDQQVVDQSVKIFQVRNELLAATPEPLKTKLAARLDWLDNYVTDLVGEGKAKMPPIGRPPVPAVAELPKEPTWGGEKAEHEAINESGITGYSLWSDKDKVEDGQSLVWTEKDQNGKLETVAQLKLRPDAMNDLDKLLKPLLPATATAYSAPVASPLNALPTDTFYNKILTAVKTINFHGSDALYNVQKVDEALAQKSWLEHLSLMGTANEQKMADQYLKVIGKIENAVLEKPTGKLSTIDNFVQYQPPPISTPLPVVPQAGSAQWSVTTAPTNFVEKFLKKGEAIQTTDMAWRSSGQAIVIDMGDVKARYIPGGAANDSVWAVQGQLEIRTAGEANAMTMDRLASAFRELGIDITPPSDDFRKALYYTKNIYFLEKSTLPPEVAAIMKDSKITDAERLQKMEDIVQAEYKKIALKPKDERWKGEMVGGDGYRIFNRADMTKEKISQDLSGYALTHASNRDLPQLIEAFLDSGGQITPTTERLRKGVSVYKTGGMSPSIDLAKGGASYFYTRIKKMDRAYSDTPLIFDISHLSRLDAYTFNGDKMGQGGKNQATLQGRGTSIADYKKFAGNGDNETLFRNGFELTEAKYIVARTALQRDQVLKVMRDHGVIRMADGRPIDQAVVVAGTQI